MTDMHGWDRSLGEGLLSGHTHTQGCTVHCCGYCMYVCFKCLLVTNWAVHSLCASLSLCCGIVYIVDAHCHVVELEMGELLTNSPLSTVVLCLSVCRVRFVHEFESADEYQEGKRGLHPEQHTHTHTQEVRNSDKFTLFRLLINTALSQATNEIDHKSQSKVIFVVMETKGIAPK